MDWTIVVTGGAGFIGSAVVRKLIAKTQAHVVNVDCLTYAGNLDSLDVVSRDPLYHFERVDITDGGALRRVFDHYHPTAVMHLAAESHVDRSIDGPAAFIHTNLVGTFTLLQESLRYWRSLPMDAREAFRFVHVSTDEVFGLLEPSGYFTEDSAYRPNSPYSATKAGSDHLARAWGHTYGLPVLITNCSNNYGPYQFPEKLIPRIILNALATQPLPVYGRGENVRDWLFVEDHADALLTVLERGRVGETYAIGGNSEHRNIDVVRLVCQILNELCPNEGVGDYASLIEFVPDRPGHDLRYAIDATRIRTELGWNPKETFVTGLRKTAQWYIDNDAWCQRVQAGTYAGERLGLGVPV